MGAPLLPRILSPEPGAWLDVSIPAVAVRGVAYAGGGCEPKSKMEIDMTV